MKHKVDDLKDAAAAKRIGQLRRDLELLAKSEKESDKATYRKMPSALRKLIRDVDGKPA